MSPALQAVYERVAVRAREAGLALTPARIDDIDLWLHEEKAAQRRGDHDPPRMPPFSGDISDWGGEPRPDEPPDVGDLLSGRHGARGLITACALTRAVRP